MRRPALSLTVPLVAALVATGCTGGDSGGSGSGSGGGGGGGDESTAAITTPEGRATLVGGATAAELAAGSAATFFSQSPVVVLAPTDDLAAQGRAASVAVRLGTPLLLAPAEAGGAAGAGTSDSGASASPSGSASASASASAEDPTAAQVDRLGVRTVLAVGAGAADYASTLPVDLEVVTAPEDPEALGTLAGVSLAEPSPVAPEEALAAVAALPRTGDEGTFLTVDAAAASGSGSESESESASADEAGDAASGSPTATPSEEGEAPAPDPQDERLAFEPGEPVDGVTVLTAPGEDVRADGPPPGAGSIAAAATARAAGAQVLVLDHPDPRAAAAVPVIASGDTGPVVALGNDFGPQEQLDANVAAAATGVELPAGGQLVAPGKMYIALYGHPGSSALGVLGEQGIEASIRRAQQVAASYEEAGSERPVVPTFEMITTVASSAAGSDGDYSDEIDPEAFVPWVEAARDAGVYVVLDLQPGRTDFLTQAQRYESLLKYPNVGLALDPEWRLRPDERHLRQIGSVDTREVNQVVEWLADLTAENALPQKMLLLHQFRTFMLRDRHLLDTSRDELAIVIQMDGHGAPGTKFETWGILRQDSPEGVFWGWKNFYDEDTPTFTPARTLDIDPTPVFVSYQ